MSTTQKLLTTTLNESLFSPLNDVTAPFTSSSPSNDLNEDEGDRSSLGTTGSSRNVMKFHIEEEEEEERGAKNEGIFHDAFGGGESRLSKEINSVLSFDSGIKSGTNEVNANKTNVQ